MEMNRTVDELQAKYAVRFSVTAAAVVGAAVTIHLIWLGKTGGHLLLTMGIAIICIVAAWTGMRDLHRRWVQLRQLRTMHERGPYHRREYVPPDEAARQLGEGNGPNMWA
jgi:hypothetical protein